jgi:hypothetical protein
MSLDDSIPYSGKMRDIRLEVENIHLYMDGIDSGTIEFDPDIFKKLHEGIRTLTPALPPRPAKGLIPMARPRRQSMEGEVRLVFENAGESVGKTQNVQCPCPWCGQPLRIEKGVSL